MAVTRSGAIRVERLFTSSKDPDDPYQLMVEGFAEAALSGRPAPLPLEESIANLRVLARIRAAAGMGRSGPYLAA